MATELRRATTLGINLTLAIREPAGVGVLGWRNVL